MFIAIERCEELELVLITSSLIKIDLFVRDRPGPPGVVFYPAQADPVRYDGLEAEVIRLSFRSEPDPAFVAGLGLGLVISIDDSSTLALAADLVWVEPGQEDPYLDRPLASGPTQASQVGHDLAAVDWGRQLGVLEAGLRMTGQSQRAQLVGIEDWLAAVTQARLQADPW